ncbi:hypothetical protein VPNG_09806 [Cytospora leucostoma]|uniref:Pectinesterase n=1 Tax=Cytospora leucostoma TaxID=1230097 RepID=A0A423VGI3_9PEZI|nr:hypothetical protein VPNG_09806 [Cytospora leucostoma]
MFTGTTNSDYYTTLGDAVDALSGTDDACIFIYSGTYTLTEQVRIDYGGNLTIYGYTTDYKQNVVNIEWSKTSSAAGSLDASAALNVVSDNFNLYNINVKNTYGSGSQAVALTANGNQQGYYGVGFYGYQDTLYAKSGYQYYSNSYIEGAVDFIFGDASAWFGECTIASNGGGAITASSRSSSSDTSWYVIDHSTAPDTPGTPTATLHVNSNSNTVIVSLPKIEAASGYSLDEKVYLGRPWRALARVIFQYSSLSDVINPTGWTTLYDGATPIFEEYENTGNGSSTSDRDYETTATAAVTKAQLWPDGYSWIDTSY